MMLALKNMFGIISTFDFDFYIFKLIFNLIKDYYSIIAPIDSVCVCVYVLWFSSSKGGGASNHRNCLSLLLRKIY